ncbi:MAG: type I-E CRISPR-associated protein Cas7/Cse4/CasC [Cumulibacter sp.]
MTLHIDIHVIQSVPPSNLNRDDTGSPKTALYGGVRRARVSSQAWKRAARRDFSNALDASELGVRTKRAVELLTQRITELAPDMPVGTASDLAVKALEAAGLKVKAGRKAKDGDQPLTEYLVFFSNVQLGLLAAVAAEAEDGKVDTRAAKNALNQAHSVDVALFGRMVADDANLNVDAACQVAHAIGTHAVTTEFDYDTAVDDKNPAEETGAGMIGTIEFDSATLYRYATINVDELRRNLGDTEAMARAVEAFVRSFATSMPTGKQNTFANRTAPDAVVVMARRERPVNLVGAFEEPVRGHGGYVAGSCEAFADYAVRVTEAYGDAPTDTWMTRVGARTDALASLGESMPFDRLARAVADRARQTADQP